MTRERKLNPKQRRKLLRADVLHQASARLPPDTVVWVKVRKPNGKFVAYTANTIEHMTGVQPGAVAIVVELP